MAGKLQHSTRRLYDKIVANLKRTSRDAALFTLDQLGEMRFPEYHQSTKKIRKVYEAEVKRAAFCLRDASACLTPLVTESERGRPLSIYCVNQKAFAKHSRIDDISLSPSEAEVYVSGRYAGVYVSARPNGAIAMAHCSFGMQKAAGIVSKQTALVDSIETSGLLTQSTKEASMEKMSRIASRYRVPAMAPMLSASLAHKRLPASDFATWLGNATHIVDMDLYELSKETGLSFPTLYLYNRGRAIPTEEHADRIAEALKVTPYKGTVTRELAA